MKSLIAKLPDDILTIICGDFNIDLMTSPQNNILTLMEQRGYQQLVKQPTTDYGSLLDHVYINKPMQVDIKVFDTYYTDHDLVSAAIHIKSNA